MMLLDKKIPDEITHQVHHVSTDELEGLLNVLAKEHQECIHIEHMGDNAWIVIARIGRVAR